MPYILVRCLMDGKTEDKPFDGMTTYIDFNANYEDVGFPMIMSRLSATRVDADSPDSPHCTYSTSELLYEVLNSLETEGYKVVGTNNFLAYHIWTLCKQRRIECNLSKDEKQQIYGLLQRCITLVLVWIILSFLYSCWEHLTKRSL